MKRLTCLALVLLMALPFAAFAQAPVAPLTMEELNTWTAQLLARAMEDKLEIVKTAAGFEAQGEGYTLYLAHDDLSADSVLLGVLLKPGPDDALPGPRGTHVGQPVNDLLLAFPNDNPHLAGTEEAAVLYMSGNLPTPVATGVLRRSGQTVLLIEHELYYLADNGVDRAGVQYTMDENGVAAIRYYAASEAQPLADAEAALTALSDLQEQNAYFAFDTANPEPLQGEDLTVAGLHFNGLTMETAVAALGKPVHEETVEDTGGDIRTAQWDGVEIAFVKESKDGTEIVDRITLTGSQEGPRGIRVGEPMAVVLSRLPYDGGDVPERSTVLYGDAEGQVPPYGTLQVAGNDAQAYYALDVGEGQGVLMTLVFVSGTLAELTIARL